MRSRRTQWRTAVASLVMAGVGYGLASEVRAEEPSREQLIARLAETEGGARVDLLDGVSKAHWSVSTDKALDYARQAERESRRLGYAQGEAAALSNVGVAYCPCRPLTLSWEGGWAGQAQDKVHKHE